MSRCVSDRFVLAAIGLYAALCPYSKVEESFGLQATHDLLFLGPRPEALQSFDHLEFPGVVPRTFVGPAITSAIVWPLHVLSEFSRRASVHDAVASQLLVRSALGLLFWFAYRSLREATAKRFSKRAGSMFGWLTFAQFHILYYCTRTLPNSFALVVTSVGFSLWLKVFMST
jgi:alpha-1,6-mannosyltransferase